ncbi:MAG TPA: bifunctional DNA-formamidopyrimidine glycosylase/DNA-(apurinic or apyrimidinic site) lyase [Phycisphaerae bacterium]|nr:bifunctional DNA-formamidopyrimidine glycosylase/DNA-(apurinic or apyrimidinic site) lyase [Phycisphaerae bacterium]
MPELPEVETIASRLAAHLPGAVIESVHIHRADIIHHGGETVASGLTGMRVAAVDRHGKRLFVRLDGGDLVVHLGMTGWLTLLPASEPVLPHTHVRFAFTGRTDELRFRDPRRFGGIWFFGAGENGQAQRLNTLGPDALSIRVPVLRTLLKRRRQIKALLMDQQAISGLGNIYCDEALFSARIHPLTLAAALSESQVRNLACAIRKVLRASIRSGGTTISDYRGADGQQGDFQNRLRVYDREGGPCTRCGAKIRRILAAGRSTHYCPRCQKRRR